jgi:DNA polymerase elongation subunit (family B)
MEVHAWGIWQQNIGLNQIQKNSRVLGFGAKPLGKPVEWRSEHHDGREEMIDRAWHILNEADVVVHWNGTKFDIPWLYREFVVAGLKPPSPVLQLDLCNVVRRRFRFESNKLQNVSTMLGLEGKLSHTGHQMWTDCLAGDPKAWALMRRYCKQDVALTEQMYLRLLPWIPNHPHLSLDDRECAKCGSQNIQWRGYDRTAQGQYRRYQCQSCGGWGRETKAINRVSAKGL